MKTNIYNNAVALSDQDLLARTLAFASQEREGTAGLVAHLAVLELRPAAHAAAGYGSLFGYCTHALRLSEDAACTRIAAARLCRRFPAIADLMASGSLNLTAVRLLGPHLTPENHRTVLARAANKLCKEIEALIAEVAPQPDVVASVRKLPSRTTTDGTRGSAAGPHSIPPTTPVWAVAGIGDASASGGGVDPVGGANRSPSPSPTPSATPSASPSPSPSASESASRSPSSIVVLRRQRPIVKASAPERYRVQFTIGREDHDKLRRVQALLRREIPDGDPGLIFGRALELLLEKVEKAKLGRPTAKLGRSTQPPRRVIRLKTDDPAESVEAPWPANRAREDGARSRHIPASVRAAVWKRDGAQCAFRAPSGTRCTERTYLEFHHVQPYAREGAATIANISLRCRRHNQYEAELIFGAWHPDP